MMDFLLVDCVGDITYDRRLQSISSKLKYTMLDTHTVLKLDLQIQ